MAAANLCDPLADEQLNLADQQPQQPTRWIEKSVIIHRDENGFGLRVGGQNPVFVDYVHENGAAWRAGVRSGDLIIKVNGTLVKSLDHKIVVEKIQGATTFVNLTLHSPVEPPTLIGSSLLGSAAHRASSTNLSAYPPRGHITLHSQASCSPSGPQSSVTTSPSSLITHHLMQQIPSQNQQRYQQGSQDQTNNKGNPANNLQIGQPTTAPNNHSTNNISYNHANNSPTVQASGNGKPGSNITSPRLFNIENDGHNHNLHHLMSSNSVSISKPMISRPNPMIVACQTMPGGTFSAIQHQNSVFVKANSEIIHHQSQQFSNPLNTELLVWQAIEKLFAELISRNTEIRHQDIKLTLLQFFHYSLTTQRHSTHPTLFFVIAELYRAHAAELLMARCNKRELSLVKRWAFEIFSTFLIPNAPLTFASFNQKKLDKIADIINNQAPICSSLSVSSSPALIVSSSGHHSVNASNATTSIHSLSNSSTATGQSTSNSSNMVSKSSADYMQSLVNIFESVSKQTSDLIKNQVEDFEQHLSTDHLRDPVVNSTITAAAAAIVGILCDIVVCKLSPNSNQCHSNTNTLSSVDSGFTPRNSSTSMISSLANSSSSNSGDTISLASSVSTTVSRSSTLEVVSLSDAVNLLVVKIESVMLSGLSAKDEDTARDFISLLAQITSFATILRIAFNQQLLVTGNIATFLSTNYPSTRRCASSVEPGGLYVTASIAAPHKSTNSQPHKRHKSLPASSNASNSSNQNQVIDNTSGASGSYHPLQNLLQSSTSSSSKQTNSSSASQNHQSSINDRIEMNGHNFISYCDTAVLYCNGCGLPLFAWFSYACSSCEVYSHRWCLKKASETACIDTTRNNSSSASRATKMSTRSSKYRPRNLRSRLVEDFKSLKITAQPTASSLSSSSSSSSLTDCDQDTTWLEYYDASNETVPGTTNHSSNKSETLSASESQALTSKNYQSSEDLLLFGDDNVVPTSASASSLQNLSSNSLVSHSQITSSQADNAPSANSTTTSAPNNNNNNHTDSQSNIFDASYSSSTVQPQQQQQQQQHPPLPPPPTNTKQKSTTKRLEIIKELLETERAHVGRLKHLDDLFYKPLVKESMMTPEQSQAVFSCHKRLYKIHKQIYRTLISARTNRSTNNGVSTEPLLGKVLVQVFLSDIGKQLEQASCEFCACQATNSEVLNKLTRRDSKAADFLAQAGNQPSIGRLGIKDLLASCFQRLTKYPLLLENLLKTTPKEKYGIEHDNIKEALDKSREILVHVDDAVKMSVSQHRLVEIWRRTDKHASLQTQIDITNQTLLHDGLLALRLRNRSVDVHVLLMTDYLVILTKDSQDKFKLRPFPQDGSKSSSLSPIFHVDKDLETRNIATDGNAFYLLRTAHEDSRMYEFCAQSPNDRAKWSEKIQLAVDQKKRFLSIGMLNSNNNNTTSLSHDLVQHKRHGCDLILPYKNASQPSLVIDSSREKIDQTITHSKSGVDLSSSSSSQFAVGSQEQKIQQIDSELRSLLEQRRSLIGSSFDINQADLDLIVDTSNHDQNPNIRLNLACSAMTVTELLCEPTEFNSETLHEAILKLRSNIESFLQNDGNHR